MLGWYGLHDSSGSSNMFDRDRSPTHVEDNSGSPHPASTPVYDEEHYHHDHHLQQDDDRSGASAQPTVHWTVDKNNAGTVMPDSEGEIDFKDKVSRWDGLSIQAIPPPPMPFEGMPSQPQNGNNQDKKMGGRKLIGMRYLFPPPSEGLSLLEKAQIWVARHDYKYFVGWNEDQLSRVDPALRPICVITSDLYKMHMNRSEYCRNVKLKYCLESDTEWAQEFREKLARPYNKGGFSGLCQAKIVAAELWRKHSENYKSHQARYPNPKSKYRAKRISTDLPNQASYTADNMFSVASGEFYKYGQDLTQRHQRSDAMEASESGSVMRFINSFRSCDDSRDSLPEPSTLQEETHEGSNVIKACNNDGIRGPMTENTASNDVKDEYQLILQNSHTDIVPKSGFEDPPGQRGVYQFESIRSRPQVSTMRGNYVNSSANYCTSSPINAVGADALSAISQIKKNISGRNNDFRKSERGLSYLFPSLIDQQLSLLDKVRITVLRHKNNYFLGWGEEQLKRVDPLVRPKMPVTRDLYKEYCHRNAMKYDSNLQFAMESQTYWAAEFRERLVKPPNEGGFHSLCEVKQEAGRLWKEFSGRYKMHNVVKAQMDMNNEQVKTPAVLIDRTESVCCLTPDDMTDFRSTTSSPGPRLDRITSPIRKFISRSANSSPTHVCEESLFRYPTADFPVHDSRKRKQSNDSGCSSLPSPTHGTVDTDKHKHDFACRPNLLKGDANMFDTVSLRASFAHQESMHHDAYFHPKIPRMQRSSSCMASEVTNSMLFAPLPPELSVVNQLLIWLQRHRSNYFIGWSQAQIDKLDPFLRPLYVVNPDVLKSHVSPTMFALFDKLEEVMSSPTAWAKDYQDKLSLPPEKGGFRTIELALTEAMHIWTTHCQPKISPQREKDVQNPGLLKLKDMFREKSSSQGHSCTSNVVPQHVDRNNTLEGLLHSNQVKSSLDNTESKASLVVAHRTEMSYADETVLDLSNKSSSITNNIDVNKHHAEASARAGPVTNLISTLWNCRQQLQQVCRDSVASSWQDRLQPHLGLLHEKLGENYQLPTCVSDCMVDLMLVLLHESITETG